MEKCQDCHQCSASLATPSVHQTLKEMEFERGIWKAALDADISRINVLLERGVDINLRDESGYTALHYAARQGELKTVMLLLSRGASVNLATRAGGLTALHRSAHQGHTDIVRVLLDREANAELRDADGKTPLHKAAEMGQVDSCKLLLARCPVLRTIADNKGNTPLDVANNKLLRSILSGD